MTYPNIHKIITEKGYKGSVASLRMFIQKERIRNEAHLSQQETCSDYQSKEYIQRRSLIQLIYKGLSDVKTITKTQYEQVLKTYPVITELYAAIKEFYEILYSRRDERLETWLEKIENFNIPELQTYVNGIRIDINAVKNGIKLKYNNGLAEGSVNKLSKGESLDSDMNVQEPVNVIYQTIISVKSLCFSSIVISTDALAYIILGHEEKNTMTFLSD